VRFEKLNIGNAPRFALQRSGMTLNSLARLGVIIEKIGRRRAAGRLRWASAFRWKVVVGTWQGLNHP
jgi:hypothetical protein